MVASMEIQHSNGSPVEKVARNFDIILSQNMHAIARHS